LTHLKKFKEDTVVWKSCFSADNSRLSHVPENSRNKTENQMSQ